MKRGDPLTLHHERMHELHAVFTKKAAYHKQKAFLELKDIYWLVHEFFTSFLQRDHNFTEEELAKEIREFKHEFFTMPQATVDHWHDFLLRLSHYQYSGMQPDQEALHLLLDQFSMLVDETLGKAYAPPDEITKQIQEASIFVKHGDLDRATAIYRAVMQDYDKLDAEKRKEHYEQLQKLYKSIADGRSGEATASR